MSFRGYFLLYNFKYWPSSEFGGFFFPFYNLYLHSPAVVAFIISHLLGLPSWYVQELRWGPQGHPMALFIPLEHLKRISHMTVPFDHSQSPLRLNEYPGSIDFTPKHISIHSFLCIPIALSLHDDFFPPSCCSSLLAGIFTSSRIPLPCTQYDAARAIASKDNLFT